ncbi:hypothetical protein [Roseibium alexandrii]|uniref:hypothetical protein n=1 Tax=Roseibium alexandrii TaxID=388408 RepID=UPI003750103C
MTRDEINLLLFFETCAVDHGGLVRDASMNADDVSIAKRWSENGYIKFERVCSQQRSRGGHNDRNHVATLGDEAFKDAHRHRRERADRQYKLRSRLTAAEARAAS